MKSKKLRFGEGFRVALGNRRSQTTEMVLPAGDAEGDRDNRHRGADQWLCTSSPARAPRPSTARAIACGRGR